MTRKAQMESQLLVLMRDFGYAYIDGYIVCKGVRGFISASTLRRANSFFDAAQHLCSICGAEYVDRFNKITKPTE